MIKYHKITICGLARELPIKAVSKNTKLANFNFLGDVELVEKISKQLKKKLQKYDFDYIVGPEVKVVPLLNTLAKEFKHSKYVVCRKTIKRYMIKPTILKPLPYFPKHIKPLVIDGPDANLLRRKKVAIVDDVVSTGVTMRMLRKLMENIEAEIVVTAAVIKQGEKQFDEIKNFVYLATLPIFKE
jgi:adenine phosphoribosyltransferase